MRAEDAAVDVGLVDHDDREVGEQVRPRAVVGQDPEVQHVGVGEHDVRAPADLRARLARRVAVVDRRAHLRAEAEGRERARLVLGERLGRIEVERARARVAQSTSSVGRLKHSDLPDAVPVVTIVGPAHAAASACAWWE